MWCNWGGPYTVSYKVACHLIYCPPCICSSQSPWDAHWLGVWTCLCSHGQGCTLYSYLHPCGTLQTPHKRCGGGSQTPHHLGVLCIYRQDAVVNTQNGDDHHESQKHFKRHHKITTIKPTCFLERVDMKPAAILSYPTPPTTQSQWSVCNHTSHVLPKTPHTPILQWLGMVPSSNEHPIGKVYRMF